MGPSLRRIQAGSSERLLDDAANRGRPSELVEGRRAVTRSRPRLEPESEPERQPKAAGVPTPQPLRIQFIGAANSAPSVLREDKIRASDVSAAIIAAAIAAWPPHTIALRILDREGQEVFGRQESRRPISLTAERFATGSSPFGLVVSPAVAASKDIPVRVE